MRSRVVPQASFADLQLQRQGIGLDQALEAISTLLDQHSHLVDLVHRDLIRNLRNPRTGRRGMTAEQVLRSFVLKGVKS